MKGALDGRAILVTGGTGSFGKELVRTALRDHRPSRLVVLSRDEQKQYEMACELSPDEHECLRYFIGDVRDRDRLVRAMHGIDTVVHAAAMKHVPIAEYNPFECIRTNVGGAENVISAAIDCGVERVIALSTDKAANPINLYGATKLASDKCFIAANHLAGGRNTRFSVVRYGNVVGSRGSVVLHWRRLAQEGAGVLPVTDLRMTRFWITLGSGVRFVLDRLRAMRGGELFIPKIKSMKLVDLATAIAPGCDLRETGIRPGEKLHEVLLPREEARQTFEFRDHYTVHPSFDWWVSDDCTVEGGETGRPVKDDFEYASNTNDEWLTREELLAMLDE